MIGDDDFSTFFDPDDFGSLVVLIEPGRDARQVAGMFGKPGQTGALYRAGIDPGAAQIKARPLKEHLQLPTREVPASWKVAKVVSDGVEYSITDVEPIGRLRSLLTLIPYGDREAQPVERGKWRASN